METAQTLGLKFCEENFPGHPAIVCTHPDGHNHSGNIHVHIVIGSVRTREVERKPYMQKPRDWREGMKHSSTAQTMRHLRVEVMELCESAGLYQIDLINGSKERVSEAEYWARRRGQQKLDLANAALTAAGQQPRQKKFETVKDTLRRQISSVLYRATSFEDFSDRLMQQYGITVKESRGQLSYLPAGRTKFIRAKHLGDNYDKKAVFATLNANAEHKPKVQFKQDTIGKLIDIQAKLAEGKGTGYERWAKKYNLKAMAQTLILLQEKDLLNEDALNQRIAELETKYHDALAVVKDLEGRMKANKELRYQVAAYTSTKNITQQLGEYYRSVFSLLNTGFQKQPYARFAAIPSFSPEYAMSVEKRNGRYTLVSNTLSRTYWQAEKGTVTVDTKSVVISASLYQSLGAIFRLVTEQVQDLDGSTAGLDGIVYFFSSTDEWGVRWATDKNPDLVLAEFSKN